jgi:hypothetical protein
VLTGPDDSLFATGVAGYLDKNPAHATESARVHVHVRFEREFIVLGVLDTGAEWSVIGTEIAEVLGLLDLDGDPDWDAVR